MAAQLSARFDNRDTADLALMRLRRSGIQYSSARVSTPSARQNTEFPGDDIRVVYPYNPGSVNQASTGASPYFPFIGAQAVMGKTSRPAGGDAILQLVVSEEHSRRAREILRNAHGRDIRVK